MRSMAGMRSRRCGSLAAAALALAASACLGEPAPTTPLGAAGLPARLTFTPTGDTFVRETRPRRSFGSEPFLEVDGDPRQVSYLRFNVQGTDGQRITRVRLRMYQLDAA